METRASAQFTAEVVLFVIVVVVERVKDENHPIINVAIATVNAMSNTAAINGEIPFIANPSIFLS
jgi:hypothetical protein